MLRFSFKVEPPLGIKNSKTADAQVIGTELMRISAQHGGQLTPEDTLEAARNRRNVLHKHFEWNNEVAAEAYRLDQARLLIRIVRVTDTDRDERERRAFVSVNEHGRAYRSVGEILDSRSLQLVVLQQAERELASWEERYRDLVEICSLVRSARTRLTEIRTEMEARPQ